MAYPDSDNATGLLLAVIVLSFIVASSLSVYPLSPSMATLRPMVMMMVLIFWLLFQPRYVGVFAAFTIGIIADLLMDTHLGQQAFAAVVVLKLPPGIYIKSFEKLDFLTFSLMVPGVGLQPWMDKGGHGHEDRNQPL